jgi:hypothetical protein
MNDSIPPDLIARLLAGPVRRIEIATTLDIKTGVSRRLRQHAAGMQPPHSVERRYKGQQLKVEYHLRPSEANEGPGQLFDMPDLP